MARAIMAAVFARGGDTKMARLAAGEAARFLRAGEPMPDALHEWLVDALEQIADGAKPGVALGVERAKNQRARARPRIDVAAWIAGTKEANPGASQTAVIEAIAEKFHLSKSTVERIWRAHRHGFEQLAPTGEVTLRYKKP